LKADGIFIEARWIMKKPLLSNLGKEVKGAGA
jgi:hypothetical protein